MNALITTGLAGIAFPKDETSLLVKSVSASPSAAKTTYGSADSYGATVAVQFRNPMITFTVDAYAETLTGLANQQLGTEISALTNFTTVIFGTYAFGHAPADGFILYEDPTLDGNQDENPSIRFNAVHYPFGGT